MGGWNFADLWEVVADLRADEIAQVHGARRISWTEFDRRAEGVASALLDAGVGHQDKVAQYLYNGVEYLESFFAAAKIGMVPVNTNYRYTDDELLYLWDNADAAAIVFHATFADRVEAIRDRLPNVKLWLCAEDGTDPCPHWAVPYEAVATAGDRAHRAVAPWGRRGDDLMFLYTGGTTGYPKGVMWRQDDLCHLLTTATGMGPHLPESGRIEDFPEAFRASDISLIVALPAAPLMHGTGLMVALLSLLKGARLVYAPSRRFDAVEMLQTLADEHVNTTVIVGDPFCRPIVEALDANPGRWDLSALFIITSSGAMWSQPVKQRLMAHLPTVMLVDSLGSSEAIGLGSSVSTGSGGAGTASFSLGAGAIVLDDDNRPVAPGSGVVGRLGLQGFVPVGYYKDPEKSAATFPVIDGVRYSMPGDFATIEADGSITLLGRGSACINTGGEKVFPEEVEEALKTHPAVRDAVAVGVPDERFGERVVAVVEPEAGTDAAPVIEADLIDHVRTKLAAYKAPRHIVEVATVDRAPNGKVDYNRLRALAVERLGPTG